MAEIILKHGQVVMVDDEDYGFLSKCNWFLDSKGYAFTVRNILSKRIAERMHHLIMNTPNLKACDHINGDRLDNRRSNLRICTHEQNGWNRKVRSDSKSKYRGVALTQKNRWNARVQKDKKMYYIGTYDTEIEAAIAWNEKSKELFGEYARLNIIE